METVVILEQLVKELGFENVIAFAQTKAIEMIESKIKLYEGQVLLFEEKYHDNFVAFEKQLTAKNWEGFEAEDIDIMDWEFASKHLAHYQNYLKLLKKTNGIYHKTV